MLILSIILRITGYTQEQLANEVGLTRASINSWLNDDSSMSYNSRQKIADRFNFPVSFFDFDINQDMKVYKAIYETINNNWRKEKKDNISKIDKINEILNSIDSDNQDNIYNTNDIMEGLINGYNPFTGEVFDDDNILLDYRVRSTLEKLYCKNKFGVTNITKDDLNKEERDLFERLRRWRLDKRDEEGYYNAYVVFNDRELINIVKANVKNKEDLKNIKGIGYTKYNKYGDDLYNIIYKWNQENKHDDSDALNDFNRIFDY